MIRAPLPVRWNMLRANIAHPRHWFAMVRFLITGTPRNDAQAAATANAHNVAIRSAYFDNE